MRQFESLTFKHIYREASKCADALPNHTPISVGDLRILLEQYPRDVPFEVLMKFLFTGKSPLTKDVQHLKR